MLSTSALLADSALGAGVKCEAWPAWQRFKLLYLSHDGRIVDASTEAQITTSAGQSYALFFALVSNDREAFDRILRWTHNNLCGSQLERILPACKWGRADDGAWRVLDSSSATDADLWIAYTLGEAARLWNEQRYSNLGAMIAENILQQEVETVPGLGTALLPGPHGFVTGDSGRLNASHLPLSVLRGLARQTQDPLWDEIIHSSEQIILGSAPNGFAADWIEHTHNGFIPDRRSRAAGSYDAIRVYLWAGMLPASDPARDPILNALKPILESAAKRAAPVEVIDTQTLEMRGDGPPGFSAALLPMLANARMTAALQTHRQRAADGSLQNNQSYYSDALTLFGLGWLEQRYRFNRSGLLNVRWTPASDRPH
ncbi:cellulose synthase complex periplasmic endoglucanase BcsZ [Steroidobacter cummioxidans]|uniref:cellulose synthase complex periplasmic endoglucanase BcsZ n=1 Tax=Steroidobacter cummioxidans TaxID=1803913 RepID=UPI000E31F3A9|nr:cellulose synthase complex periplasmic endoglucanase BcsZ [Steroidobacter cummioxidans]